MQTYSTEAVTSVATVAAVLVALAGYGFLEWQRRQAIKVARRTAAHMIGIRVFRLLNHACSFEKHFSRYREQNPAAPQTSLLPDVHPLIGTNLDSRVELKDDEVALLIESKQSAFLTELMLAAATYEAVVISLNEYRDRYEALYRMIPPPVSMEGKTGTHQLTMDEIMKFRPYSIQLFELVAAIRTMVMENAERGRKLSAQYHPMMKTCFKGERFISLKEIRESEDSTNS